METPKIFESEYRFCLIMWEHEPVSASTLVKMCQEQLGWKRTTTYTVIKRQKDGLAGTRTQDLCVISTTLYRLSYETTR